MIGTDDDDDDDDCIIKILCDGAKTLIYNIYVYILLKQIMCCLSNEFLK
jgi:hypothetical protein